jgi:hypothetical protein
MAIHHIARITWAAVFALSVNVWAGDALVFASSRDREGVHLVDADNDDSLGGKQDLTLRRYEGRYLIDEYFDSTSDDRNRHIRHFADASVDGEALVLQKRSRDHLEGEHPPGDTYALTPTSEHTFDAVEQRLQFEFVLGDDGVAESVIVIEDGEPSDPGPRFLPLPKEIPDRRERSG